MQRAYFTENKNNYDICCKTKASRGRVGSFICKQNQIIMLRKLQCQTQLTTTYALTRRAERVQVNSFCYCRVKLNTTFAEKKHSTVVVSVQLNKDLLVSMKPFKGICTRLSTMSVPVSSRTSRHTTVGGRHFVNPAGSCGPANRGPSCSFTLSSGQKCLRCCFQSQQGIYFRI